MHGFVRRIGQVAPAASSVVVPWMLTASRDRDGFCAKPSRPSRCADSPKTESKQLFPGIDTVYKSWGKRGFEQTYTIVGEIGKGTFGTVYKARSKINGTYRAVKVIGKSKLDLDSMRHEITALLHVDHPHIIKLIRYYDEDTHFYLIFELCTGPDLLDSILEGIESDAAHMSEYSAAVALRHMLKALKCCHSKFMGHYDIKPENFMYGTPSCTTLKMIDLGTSNRFATEKNTIKGTYQYMAPEVHRGIYGPEADVWSCGVVLFVMLTGVPFLRAEEPEECERLINDRQWVIQRVQWASEQDISAVAVDLLKQMLIPDRHMRISVAEVLQHPFVQDSYRQGLHDEKQQSEAVAILKALPDNLRSFSSKPMLTRATLMLTSHLVAYDLDKMHSLEIAFRMLDNLLYCKETPTQEMTRREGVGYISVYALERALQAFNISVPEDIWRLFNILDMDNDGYITYTDFLSVSLPPSVLQDDVNFRPAFKFFDNNEDGFIDANDLIAALGCKTEGEIKTCHEAMREVCPAPGPLRLDYEHFFQLFQPISSSSA